MAPWKRIGRSVIEEGPKVSDQKLTVVHNAEGATMKSVVIDDCDVVGMDLLHNRGDVESLKATRTKLFATVADFEKRDIQPDTTWWQKAKSRMAEKGALAAIDVCVVAASALAKKWLS
jgi:hypothetical protein